MVRPEKKSPGAPDWKDLGAGGRGACCCPTKPRMHHFSVLPSSAVSDDLAAVICALHVNKLSSKTTRASCQAVRGQGTKCTHTRIPCVPSSWHSFSWFFGKPTLFTAHPLVGRKKQKCSSSGMQISRKRKGDTRSVSLPLYEAGRRVHAHKTSSDAPNQAHDQNMDASTESFLNAPQGGRWKKKTGHKLYMRVRTYIHTHVYGARRDDTKCMTKRSVCRSYGHRRCHKIKHLNNTREQPTPVYSPSHVPPPPDIQPPSQRNFW